MIRRRTPLRVITMPSLRQPRIDPVLNASSEHLPASCNGWGFRKSGGFAGTGANGGAGTYLGQTVHI